TKPHSDKFHETQGANSYRRDSCCKSPKFALWANLVRAEDRHSLDADNSTITGETGSEIVPEAGAPGHSAAAPPIGPECGGRPLSRQDAKSHKALEKARCSWHYA